MGCKTRKSLKKTPCRFNFLLPAKIEEKKRISTTRRLPYRDASPGIRAAFHFTKSPTFLQEPKIIFYFPARKFVRLRAFRAIQRYLEFIGCRSCLIHLSALLRLPCCLHAHKNGKVVAYSQQQEESGLRSLRLRFCKFVASNPSAAENVTADARFSKVAASDVQMALLKNRFSHLRKNLLNPSKNKLPIRCCGYNATYFLRHRQGKMNGAQV